MKLTFFGAARAVTGSCHCVECNGKKYLLDCGLQQGKDEMDNAVLDFNPGMIDAVIVSHAHIDHSGRLPLLVKRGFHGPIYCSGMTAKLLGIMLLDSAHIQESDAAYVNQKGRRAGREKVEPLYSIEDAQATLDLLTPYPYDEREDLGNGVELRFTDAGHLLGSAQVELWLTEDKKTRKLVFTGDLGNLDQPIIRDPQPITEQADYLITESTYGDRLHGKEEGSYKESLAAIIDKTMARGGNIIIPSFAVGRTQELLYYIREIKEEGLVKSRPGFQVVVDSPLAKEATEIFAGDLSGYLDEDAIQALRHGDLFRFPGLTLTQTLDESKALNLDPTPKVIISASGMCEAGRIRHHLKHNLWRRECTVVFVGYQAMGSLGRRILDGAEWVKLFGEEISVQAQIVKLEGLSSHADRDGLLRWMEQFTNPRPRQVFVVHGDQDVTVSYARLLQERGFAAHAPDYEEVYDLLADRMLAPGIPPAVKEEADSQGYPASAAFKRLEDVGEQLMAVIQHNRGGTNKDLGKFADQLRALIQKWDR